MLLSLVYSLFKKKKKNCFILNSSTLWNMTAMHNLYIFIFVIQLCEILSCTHMQKKRRERQTHIVESWRRE